MWIKCNEISGTEIVNGRFSEGISITSSLSSSLGRLIIWTPYCRKLKTYIDNRMRYITPSEDSLVGQS